jgi:hypothetical protein
MCAFRRTRVSSPLAASRVVYRMWRDWDWGRVKRNSSTRRQHVANPRPLFVEKTYLSVVVGVLRRGGDLPVGAGY